MKNEAMGALAAQADFDEAEHVRALQSRACSCHQPISSGNGPCGRCAIDAMPDPGILIRRIRAVYSRVTPSMFAVGPWHSIERAR